MQHGRIVIGLVTTSFSNQRLGMVRHGGCLSYAIAAMVSGYGGDVTKRTLKACETFYFLAFAGRLQCKAGKNGTQFLHTSAGQSIPATHAKCSSDNSAAIYEFQKRPRSLQAMLSRDMNEAEKPSTFLSRTWNEGNVPHARSIDAELCSKRQQSDFIPRFIDFYCE